MSNIHFSSWTTMENSVPLIEEWQSWCRLCARANAQYVNVLSGQCQQTILTDSKCSPFAIVLAIEEFFRVHIKEDEKLSPLVCTECYNAVASFIKFSENIKIVQQMYNDLQYSNEKTNLNVQDLYEKYGLFKDLALSQTSSEVPVEEVFVAEPPTTSTTQSSKFKIKNERIDEIPTDELMKESEKKDEFEDPFGEEFIECILPPKTPTNDEEKINKRTPTPDNDDDDSSRDPDYNMQMDTSDEDEDDDDDDDEFGNEDEPSKNKSIYSENIKSENINKDRKYSCTICSQRFKRTGNYSVHMKKKHSILCCPHCFKVFENEVLLKRHIKDDHRPLFPCPHCDRKFQVKEYVAQHIKFVHDDERPFICEACGDAVRTKGQLKEHMLTHTDYSPFECKECGKCFKQKQRLKRHMQIHGDKHVCTECGKQLSTRATLNSHLLVHSDKMPHKCDYCGRLFKRAKTLKNHLIAHTGLRPYSCDFCDKTFSTGPSCRFHKKTMHPVELAALEASGVRAYTKNIPNLDVLRAVSRTAENLTPLASKQNGYATFDKSHIQQDNVNKNETDAKISINQDVNNSNDGAFSGSVNLNLPALTESADCATTH